MFLRLLLWLGYFLSSLAPRDPNLSISGSMYGDKYSNSYTLFKQGKIDYWISKKTTKNKNEIYIYSLKSLFLHIRASSVYVDFGAKDVLWFLIARAKIINLWHGMPIKKIEKDIKHGPISVKYSKSLKHILKRILYFQDSFFTYESVWVNSEFHRKVLSQSFKAKKLELHRAPRLEMWSSFPTTRQSRTIYFCFTFLDNGDSPPMFEELLNYSNRNFNLFLVLHPSDTALYHKKVREKVHNIKLGLDPRNVSRGDVLVTAQSSLLFDADISKIETALLSHKTELLRPQYLMIEDYMDKIQIISTLKQLDLFLESIFEGNSYVGWTKKLKFI